MAEVSEILAAREKMHGKFEEHSSIAQNLNRTMHNTNGWAKLAPAQAEALEMIMHKIARVLNGNPDIHDHWDDIAGYATLASKSFIEVKNETIS